ncbi:MAG: TRAP transporter large permease subunit [Nitratireductor sp.]
MKRKTPLACSKAEDYMPYTLAENLTHGAKLLIGLFLPGLLFGRKLAARTWLMSKGLIAPLLVVFIVLGSIYGGVTGITEAAGMGTVAVLVLIIIRGEFSMTLVREALMRTFKSTGTIIQVLRCNRTGRPTRLPAGQPMSLPHHQHGIANARHPSGDDGVFLFLGAFMDWVGIVLLVMPVFLPIVLKLPVEEIGLFSPLVGATSFVSVWFGILFCVNMQVSFLSPPFGPAAFYLKSVAPPHISLPDIFRGFLPLSVSRSLC